MKKKKKPGGMKKKILSVTTGSDFSKILENSNGKQMQRTRLHVSNVVSMRKANRNSGLSENRRII